MGLLQVTKLVVQVHSSTIDLEPETASLSRQCPKDNIRLKWTTRRLGGANAEATMCLLLIVSHNLTDNSIRSEKQWRQERCIIWPGELIWHHQISITFR